MQVLGGIVRFIVGALFIFSGFIKTIDPVGFGIKLTEYFEVLGMPIFIPLSNFLAIFFCVLEIVLGVALLLGYKPKTTTWLLLLLIVFFTFLTGYTYITGFINPDYFNDEVVAQAKTAGKSVAFWQDFNPNNMKVSDCGCFGDAIPLVPKESFFKDIILTILIVFLFIRRKHIGSIFGKPVVNTTLWLSTIAATLFGVYNWYYEPVKDFRPYKIGVNIPAAMTLPPGAKADKYAIKFIYKVNGELKEYSDQELSNIPNDAEFIDRKDILLEKGDKAPIHDFSITNLDGEEYTQDFLEADYALLILTYKVEKAHSKSFARINEIAKMAMSKNVKVAGLSSSLPIDIKAYAIVRNSPYETYTIDGTTLKTMMRSNPGLMLLRKGTVIGKWPGTSLPDNATIEKLIN